MDNDFLYWRHPTLPGIKVEEITGASSRSGRVWLEMAYQVYCENGKDSYRDIGHYRNGAPFLYGEATRISITHCPGFLAVATLPPTPDAELGVFSPETSMGIDAERANRAQVLKIRSRYLCPTELNLVEADDVERSIQAWTMKEAAYKAALTEGISFRDNIIIEKMPPLGPPTPVYDRNEYDPHGDGTGFHDDDYGEVRVIFPDGSCQKLLTFSYASEGHIVTLAFSPQCVRFRKKELREVEASAPD